MATRLQRWRGDILGWHGRLYVHRYKLPPRKKPKGASHGWSRGRHGQPEAAEAGAAFLLLGRPPKIPEADAAMRAWLDRAK